MSYYKDKDKLVKEIGEDFVMMDIGSCVDYLDESLLEAVARLRSYCVELIRGERGGEPQKIVKIKKSIEQLEEVIVMELCKFRSQNKNDLKKWENFKKSTNKEGE